MKRRIFMTSAAGAALGLTLLPRTAFAAEGVIDWYTGSDSNILDFWANTVKPAFEAANPGINQVAEFGTLDNPIANSVANQARSVLSANPNITVMFAPYDEFAKGVKIAVDEAGMSGAVSIYSADVSTADIAAMREPGSAWKATAATNPAVVGEVSVRALAMMLAGEDPGHNVIVPPTLITQKMLTELDITNMQDLGAKLPAFAHADVAVPAWMPLPAR